MVHGSQLGLLYGGLNGRQLPGSLPRLVIVSSSGSNVGNVSGIAGGDVDRDNNRKHVHISPWESHLVTRPKSVTNHLRMRLLQKCN